MSVLRTGSSFLLSSTFSSSSSSAAPVNEQDALLLTLLKAPLNALFETKTLPDSFFHLSLKDFAFLLTLELYKNTVTTYSHKEYRKFSLVLTKLRREILDEKDLAVFSKHKTSEGDNKHYYRAISYIGRLRNQEGLKRSVSSFLANEIDLEDTIALRVAHIKKYNSLISYYLFCWGDNYAEEVRVFLESMFSLIESDKNKKKIQGIKNPNEISRIKDNACKGLKKNLDSFRKGADNLLTNGELRYLETGGPGSSKAKADSVILVWLDRLKVLAVNMFCNAGGLITSNSYYVEHLKKMIAFFTQIDPVLTISLVDIRDRNIEQTAAHRELSTSIMRLLGLAVSHTKEIGINVEESSAADPYQMIDQVGFSIDPEHTPSQIISSYNETDLDCSLPIVNKNRKKKSSRNQPKQSHKSKPIIKEAEQAPLASSSSSSSSSSADVSLSFLTLSTKPATVFQVMDDALFQLSKNVHAADDRLTLRAKNSYKNAAYHLQALREGIEAYKTLQEENKTDLLAVVITQLTLHQHHVLECIATAEMAQTAPSYDDLALTHNLTDLFGNAEFATELELGNLWARYPHYYGWLKGNSEKMRLQQLVSGNTLPSQEQHERLVLSLERTLMIASQKIGCEQGFVFPDLNIPLSECELSYKESPLELEIFRESESQPPRISNREKMIMNLAYSDTLWHLRQFNLTLKLIEIFPNLTTLTTSSLVLHTQFLLEVYYLAHCIRDGKGIIRTEHDLNGYKGIIKTIDARLASDLNVGTMISYLPWEQPHEKNMPFAFQALINSYELGREFRRTTDPRLNTTIEKHNLALGNFAAKFLAELEKLVIKPTIMIPV